MAVIDIEQLFDNSRFPVGPALFPVVLYFPLGIVLAVLRVFIGIHIFLVSCILPKTHVIRSIILRVMCGVVGIIVSNTGSEDRVEQAKVLVSNHVNSLDHLAIGLVIPHIMPSLWDIPYALCWALGFQDLGVKNGQDSLIRNARKHCQDSLLPLLTHPEGASTNGRVGLLKFSSWPFSLNQSIQPITVRVSRFPYVPISISPLGSHWWTDLFWTLFVPYTHYQLKILPIVSKCDDESVEDFASRTQSIIAVDMDMKVTSYTDMDKVEYAKRKFFIQPQVEQQQRQLGVASPTASITSESSACLLPDPALLTMVQQVVDVLPNIATDLIQQDLLKTQDVDKTVSNIVDNPERFSKSVPSSSVSAQSSVINAITATHGSIITDPSGGISQLTTAGPKVYKAQVFARVSGDRMMSFEQRKKAMLDQARQQYLAKHVML